MFHNELLKKSTEFASQFKMPYLVPQFNDCDYCELLRKYPTIVGKHTPGCKNHSATHLK